MNEEQHQVVKHLAERIEGMRAKGHSDINIRGALVCAEGWPVRAVSDAFDRLAVRHTEHDAGDNGPENWG